jgi:ubiquinone/menaquinone biosynthesis C-methylase UbiE
VDFVGKNKDLWNEWAEINVRSPFYDVEGFKRDRSPLDAEVLAGLGDLTGKSVLHLQCHFGMDTLRLKLAGAASVVGVDFSNQAIGHARALASDMKIDARFIESNVFALPDVLDEQFDVVFTSYGVIGWLPELAPWGAIVARYLKPGGRFFIIEGHPTMWLFEGVGATDLVIKYPYFRRPEPIVFEPTVGNYADPTAKFTNIEYSWPHDLGETINSLIGAGLCIEEFREYAHTVWQAFPFMIEQAPGRFVMPPDKPVIPMMFSIRATK